MRIRIPRLKLGYILFDTQDLFVFRKLHVLSFLIYGQFWTENRPHSPIQKNVVHIFPLLLKESPRCDLSPLEGTGPFPQICKKDCLHTMNSVWAIAKLCPHFKLSQLFWVVQYVIGLDDSQQGTLLYVVIFVILSRM